MRLVEATTVKDYGSNPQELDDIWARGRDDESLMNIARPVERPLQLRDVTTSPRWFTRGAPGPPRASPTIWIGEDGVLVDLEVGAAP